MAEKNGNTRKIVDYVIIAAIVSVGSILNYVGVKEDINELKTEIKDVRSDCNTKVTRIQYDNDRNYLVKELDKKLDEKVFNAYKNELD